MNKKHYDLQRELIGEFLDSDDDWPTVKKGFYILDVEWAIASIIQREWQRRKESER